MASGVRDRMIAGAAELLSRRGLQATSFAEVTEATKTPRGSIYHHFPGGKNELVLAAIDRTTDEWRTSVAAARRTTPREFASDLVTGLRTYLEECDFAAGSAVGAVVIGAENDIQRERCRDAVDVLLACVAEGLVESGIAPASAREYADCFVPCLAGVTLVARATQRLIEFDACTRLLVDQAEALPRA